MERPQRAMRLARLFASLSLLFPNGPTDVSIVAFATDAVPTEGNASHIGELRCLPRDRTWRALPRQGLRS